MLDGVGLDAVLQGEPVRRAADLLAQLPECAVSLHNIHFAFCLPLTIPTGSVYCALLHQG